MRKNLLVATLVGLCVVGFTACSRSEDKTDNTTTTASAPANENQAVTQPESVANAAQPSADQAAPAAQPSGTSVDQNPTTTTDNSSTVPAPSDTTTAPAADNNASTTAN